MRSGSPSGEDLSLDFAVQHGTVEVVELVIKYGADVAGADNTLARALHRGRLDTAAVLLRHGVVVTNRVFEWSDDYPLGERSADEIEAWIAAAVAHKIESRECQMSRNRPCRGCGRKRYFLE